MTTNAHRARANAAGSDQAFGVGVIRIDRILCPISLDGRAADAIDQAARLATLNQAELRLLHVVPADSQPRGHGSAETAAERALADICALARRLPGRVRVSAAVTEGELIEEVVRHARLMKADLLAITTRAGRDAAPVPALATAAAEARVPILFIDAGDRRAGEPADSIVVHTADRHVAVSASCAEAARVAAMSGCPVLLQPSSDHAP